MKIDSMDCLIFLSTIIAAKHLVHGIFVIQILIWTMSTLQVLSFYLLH